MQPAVNARWCVAHLPTRDEDISSRHFAWQECRIPELQDGEFLVKTLCLAPAPAQRGYLEPGYSDFLPALAPGEVMRGRGIGQVIASRHPDHAAGEIFVGSLGWQTYSIQKPRGAEFVFSTRRIPHPVQPLSLHLGILGQAGATAWFGLLEVGNLQAGDAVLVSAAAGGVGSVAGQIARIKGARLVVGTAGSDAKCRWLCDTLGYDVAINYKTENLHERLRELFPAGIDVFFDNVGGDILDAALANLAMHARVVICGFIASNYAAEPQPGPANYSRIVYKRARMEGFVLFDYWNRYHEAEQALLGWYRAGLLKNCEDVTDGLENMPDALGELFRGGNTGIKICRVAPDPEQLTPRRGAAEFSRRRQ